MKLELSPSAKNDLRNIAEYIGRDNPGRAVSYVDEIIAKIKVIAERPLSFPARPELRQNLRSALHQPYLILFEIRDDVVYIARIMHGSRNIPENLCE